MRHRKELFVIVGAVVLVLVGALLFYAYSPKTHEGAISVVNVSEDVPVYSYKIIKTFPHDPGAFTQGLVYYKDNILYEGTGMWGESSLRKVELETGKVLQIHRLPSDLFGEGIVVWKDKIIQLTWQHRKGFVYDRETFTLLREFTYPTEGWGITHDGSRLIMSDGSATLFVWDPETLQEIGRIDVRDQNGPVARLNELEYINGLIYANVWQTDRIAIIQPDTGRVVGWIDLAGLLKPEDRSSKVDVLNGIAYDAQGDRLFVTGKYWPKLFQIQLIKSPED
jgi:glutamine cyclotransferase